jgi:hypothetical protein
MKALLIREMRPEEHGLVLSDWKRNLWDEHPDWGRSLQSDEWWALVNHVLDTVTLPGCTVTMACHRDEESIPLAWLAARGTFILHMHATSNVRRDAELAARLERALLSHSGGEVAPFNPFMELKLRRTAA